MAKRRIEVVLFDLGETLLTYGRPDRNKVSAQAALRAYEYLKELHQPVGSFQAYRRLNIWGIRWNLFKSWITGNDFNSLELLKSFGRRYGFDLSEPQWIELNWRWYQILTEYGKVVPGSIDAIKQVSQMGFKVGLLSNTFVHKSSLERHMAEVGLLELLPVRMYSYEFPWRKPDVRIFHAAAEKMSAPPEKIIYVGDRIDNDVKGAAQAGILPILIRAYTNENKTIPPGVNRINDNTELLDLIRRICVVPNNTIETPTRHVCEHR